jgi:hypothetical protein
MNKEYHDSEKTKTIKSWKGAKPKSDGSFDCILWVGFNPRKELS